MAKSSRSELLVAIDCSVLEAVETRRLEGFVCKEALRQFKDPRLEEKVLGKATLHGKTVGMEAAVVSAVISGTLKIVGNKLAPLLYREYSSMVGVREDLLELQDQVKDINTWLENAGYEALENIQSSSWLKKLNDLAHAVDDIVDEFQLEAEEHDACGDGSTVTKYMCTKPRSLMLQRKAARKLKAIKKRFAEVVKQRSDFSTITNSLPFGHRHTEKTAVDAPTLPIVDKALAVGRDQEKHQIVSKLVVANDQQNIKIVSVIGLGGSGKTTLAKLVFNDVDIIEKHFDVRLWVHVSQEFDVGKLIKKLFESFADNNPGQHALPYMCKIISEKLTGKKVLLVMDDVWTESPSQWEKFMEHLQSSKPGSGVLLTTRSTIVAGKVGSTYQFNLPLLSPDDSWRLFQKSLGILGESLESEMVMVGKEIVKKCGGVPLAIKVLAGVLQDKELIEWQAVRDSNILEVEGDDSVSVYACLRLSYFHLPSYLKPLFTICSVFPKGHKIDKEELIDLWIAHDMITPVAGVNSLEDSGLKCFNSLVQISFLQDVDEDDGRVRCRMHDLVHDFAQKILGDEISHAVPREVANSYRYFSLNSQGRNILPKNTFGKARAIYIQDSNITFGKSLKNARHLRSIHVFSGDTTVLNTILQIKYLRYLCIPWLRCETLPEAISDIWSLQALHIPSSNLLELPKSIGRLQRLRTLNLSYCRRLKGLPDSIGDCHMISVMDLCSCTEITTLPNSMERNQKLRTLKLRGTKFERLPPAITTLGHLECLDLENCDRLVELPNSIGRLQRLRTLNLSYCRRLKGLPDSIGDCHMISVMDLCSCTEITALPNSMERNQKLRTLKLGGTNFERLPPVITTLGHLECLDLENCYRLVELPDGLGKLERLEILNLKGCYKLGSMPGGVGQLRRLHNLNLFAVGESENSEPISGLGNIAGVSRELVITNIARVLEPDDSHNACLKQKTNLLRLELYWGGHPRSKMPSLENVENVEAIPILDGLEPPTGIKVLEINGYTGGKFAQWMLNKVGVGVQESPRFPYLTRMVLCGFPNLKHLEGLVELPCLEDLQLEKMPSLESISGGPFPSLLRLGMSEMHSLGEVWMVTERMALTDVKEEDSSSSCNPHDMGRVQIGFHLSKLFLNDCPKLKIKPYMPLSLEELTLFGCNEELLLSPCQGPSLFSNDAEFSSGCAFSRLKELRVFGTEATSPPRFERECRWELVQYMTALERLVIEYCHGLTELPKSMRSLTSLRLLYIEGCDALCELPDWLGELQLVDLTIKECSSLSSLSPIQRLTALQSLHIVECPALLQLPEGLGNLTSLQELQISKCDAIHQLPECLGELRSLRYFRIVGLSGLTCLPQSMGRLASLGELYIEGCPGIKSLPEWTQGLTALQGLHIWDCPDLERRCERGKGEDWHLISHIPHPFIGCVWQTIGRGLGIRGRS
ncbi:hypothetical protein ACP70R_048007 [Stipagrostis hirtigluma subsp. patula]